MEIYNHKIRDGRCHPYLHSLFVNFFAVGATAKPPRAVSLNDSGRAFPTLYIISTTSSKGTSDLTPAIAFSKHMGILLDRQ